MRLLNTSTFELETFFDSDHPPYAILSHTWGDQEVTFQEIQLEHSRSLLHSLRQRILEGETIEGFGTQADDFKYIWCDTCNIDKTSSAELSEAINSMYHWYGNQTCYAYLADVPCARRFVDAIAYSEDFDFARWFRRGWTLQELIAPSEVTFFDQKWQPIGTRTELKSYIADITGIDQDVLSGEADPLTFSVAIRMSWASKRETTRKEDVAYCLIGLFGVHMPLIYGERERAFIRLEEEIMKTTDDHSLFAWRADASLAHQLEGGLLASSPLQFQDSHNIVPIINDNPDTQSPHFMTNKGISIPLPIF
ncbi:HET-domain-containing protein, partial [Tothia fuscella]